MMLLCAAASSDMEAFEDVVTTVADRTPKLEVLRPGLLLVPAAGFASYVGSEEAAAESLIDAVAEECEAEATVGIADTMFAAWLAARDGVIVPPGGDAAFMSGRDIGALGRDRLVDMLRRMGITTLGAFAALPRAAVAERFGAEGVFCHRLAGAHDPRGLAPRTPPPELAVSSRYDPPIDRVDAAAFAARALAVSLWTRLADRSLTCQSLVIEATTTDGTANTRTWRAAGTFTPSAVMSRVRWQLEGWLTATRAEAPIASIRLSPEGILPDGALPPDLWGSQGSDGERADAVLTRALGLLGDGDVMTVVPHGGYDLGSDWRGIGWGLPPAADAAPNRPWPLAAPPPVPTFASGDRVIVRDERDAAVTVDGRGELSAAPHRLTFASGDTAEVLRWAPPRLADHGWWRPTGRRYAQLQVELDDIRTLVITYQRGTWRVEASYD